ncbi:DUF4136 domain-containing protein [Sandaracinobacter sp. RS1-74]|uniref:DUF4136 domain-containing protein n=1 Tax=Sandaracinobacteroides sayramensis TaxID=2913411 RepID=UPI001EDC163A|nr:DUF4136 domain-containing protein [Sandaracinobacteroides sayramensis]MCG2841012.1 DUF4136 domain-containing protein [Sandaracinobacteroides sayramensis]
MKTAAAILSAALMLSLGACSSTPKANVLRFHQNQAIERGTIYIRPANPQMAGSLEFQAQANAVGGQLQAQGFTVVSTPQTAQFAAVVDVQTSERMAPARQSGLSIGIGGGFSSGNVGVGTSVNVPVGGSQPRANVATTTTLSVAIVSNPGNQSVWEGRSSLDTEAGGQQGTTLAPVLAQTMFKGFPGPAGQTVQVPIR